MKTQSDPKRPRGRPPKTGPRLENRTIRLPPEALATLERLAQIERRPAAGVVRELIELAAFALDAQRPEGVRPLEWLRMAALRARLPEIVAAP